MGMLDEFDAVKGGGRTLPAPGILADFDSIKPPLPNPKIEAKRGSKEFEQARLARNRELNVMPDLAGATGNILSGMGTSLIGGWRGLAELARGGTLADAVRAVHGEDENAVARPYQPETKSAQRIVQGFESPANPLNWASVVGKKAGEVSQDLGAGPAVATGLETGINAIPLLLTRGGGPKTPAPVRPPVGGTVTLREVPPVQLPSNLDIPPQLRPKVASPTAAPGSPTANVPLREIGRPTPTPAPAVEAPVPPAAAPAPNAAQAARVAVLRRVMGDNAEVRQSAIEGDPKAGATDHQTSKLDNPAGNTMRRQFDTERQALADHGERIIRDAGGTLGLDSQALEARGHTILQPLEAFRQWFTDQTSALYKQADARAGGQPVELGSFRDILKTDSKFANTDTIELRKGVLARMKELGLVDKEGNLQPATVKQAENLRKYINEEWTPKGNGRIRELKTALDEDVTKAAGLDLYKQARSLHAMKESIFSDPKGLSSILDSEGINRKVPVEKIADSINALPNAQFQHIVQTLKTVPPELKPQAQAALSEMKSHIANRLLEIGNKQAGQWNAKGVKSYLDANAAKIRMVFDDAEIAKINDLNEAGHILRTEQSYPGAAVQEHNLVQRGVMGSIRAGGAVVGSALAGPAGAAVGDFLGAKAAGRYGEASALKKAQKRMTKLSDFPK